MKVLFINYKGGVGKSSIAFNFSAYTNSIYITNDITAINDATVVQIETKRKRIPAKYLNEKDITLDFGAMSTQVDHKVVDAINLSDVVVIPTQTDARSLQATVDTFNLINPKGKPMVIIINNFTSQAKFDRARHYLINTLGKVPVLAIRSTTLFERVSQDGRDWYQNIHNNMGEYQLNKTRLLHEQIYDVILSFGAPE